MTTTTTVPPSSTTTTTPTGNSSRVSNLTSASDQEDRFMKLLVAQMKNQDPLNPMDNAQMTSQIAQINTVGGIEKLNRTVESLLTAFGNLQSQDATSLAGRDVLVAGTQVTITADSGAIGGVELSGAADTVNVEIVDASGQVVRTLNLGASPAGVRSFGWDGLKADGQPAGAGQYTVRTVATQGGQPVVSTPLVAAHVQSVNTGSSGVQLDLGPAGVQSVTAIKSYL